MAPCFLLPDRQSFCLLLCCLLTLSVFTMPLSFIQATKYISTPELFVSRSLVKIRLVPKSHSSSCQKSWSVHLKKEDNYDVFGERDWPILPVSRHHLPGELKEKPWFLTKVPTMKSIPCVSQCLGMLNP